tara:strand:+ start:161 stop:505 length:345 start_codon:yes stop_codon:yes gene_type:complete
MKKNLLYFLILIRASNFLFFLVGFIANIAFIGSLIAVGTDPIILLLGALLDAGLIAKPLKLSVVYLWIGAVFLTILVHIVLGTTRVIVDVVRFDALLIIPALIVIVTNIFKPKK